MKRILSTGILATLFAVLTAFTSADIQGRWVSDEISLPSANPEEQMKMRCDFTFLEDDNVKVKYIMSLVIAYERKLNVDAYYEIVADGKYSCSGDSIMVLVDNNTADIKISEDDVRIKGIGLEDGMDQRQMQTLMVDMVRKSSVQKLQTEASTMDVFNNVTIDGKKMTCTLNDMPLKFKKKK